MSANFNHENWLKVLEAARVQDAPGNGPHPVDDDDLLNRWSMGDLDEQEQNSLVDHLAHCSDCRMIVASMLETGSLVLPEVKADSPERKDVSVASHEAPRSGAGFYLQMLLSVAAVVLFGTMVYLWPGSEISTADEIALLKKQLQQGEIQSVYDRTRVLLSKEMTQSDQLKLQQLLTESGSKLAMQALSQENFAIVLKIEEQLAELNSSSAQLANLKIQAERGIPEPVLLAHLDRLDRDFGFDLHGYSVTKNLNQPSLEDSTAQRIQQEFISELEQYPQSVELHLNYGHFLLEHVKLEAAIQQFDAVLALNSQNVPALMGRGLSFFKMREYDEAANAFQAALRVEPNLISAKINLAITYQKQKDIEKANRLWEEISEQSADTKLKQQIISMLKQNTSNE